MGRHMTLKEFRERTGLGLGIEPGYVIHTWTDAVNCVVQMADTNDRQGDRIEQLNDDLDRLYSARTRRRERWAGFGLAMLHGAIGAAVALGALAAREAGLWTW